MRDDLIVLQDDLKDCGVCSLLSIIRFYNGNLSKEYLRNITKTTKYGVSAYSIIEASKRIGFDSYGVYSNLDNLSNKYLPLIAHIKINNYEHFVVIYEINHNKEYLIIMDPSIGKRKITFDAWIKLSTNTYIILNPIKKLPLINVNNNVNKYIKEFIKSNKETFLIILLYSIIYTIINIVNSYNYKILMNDLDINNLKNIFIILIMFILFKNLIDYTRYRFINYLNKELDKKLTLNTFNHIINLPYLYFKNRTSGDVITRIKDLSNIKEFIIELFTTIFMDLILLIFVLYFLININIKLTLISIITIILYLIIVIINWGRVNNKIKLFYIENSDTNSNLIESINMIDTIKSYNIQNNIINRFKNKYTKLTNTSYKIMNNLNTEKLFKEFIYDVGRLLIIYLSIKDIINNEMELTTLITFITLLDYFVLPIKNIINLNILYKNAKESIKRINELYEIEEEDLNYENKFYIKNFIGNINFNNITYSYNNKDNAIENLSLNIESGKKILIYGPSGKGKSTLFKILCKFIDDYKGEIYLDNINLKNISLINIRDKIGYISQNESLFTDTIYNNITLYKDYDYEEFLKILKLCLVDEILNNKNVDKDYMLEENGFNLSGGERQRLILARSILEQKDIYILDESTSQISIDMERTILKNIFDYYKYKTIIVISHRFNNNDLFDQTINISRRDN